MIKKTDWLKCCCVTGVIQNRKKMIQTFTSKCGPYSCLLIGNPEISGQILKILHQKYSKKSKNIKQTVHSSNVTKKVTLCNHGNA